MCTGSGEKGEKEVRNRITSVMYDRVTRRSKESNF